MLILHLLTTFSGVTFALGQTYLRGDISKDTYQLINSVLGNGAVEDPDCSHKKFGQHIKQEIDPLLARSVFLFYIHVNQDNDRCNKFDRQRNEIKTFGPSSETLKGRRGETVSLSWNFFLNEGFQPSKAFTHIHQIKDNGGKIGTPILTLTPRYNSKENRFEIIHVDSNEKKTTLGSTDLGKFIGQWIHVKETLTYDTRGKYAVTFSSLGTRKVIWEYKNSKIDLWRSDAEYVRPKWGIYRGLTDKERLRDEVVKFDTFCLGKGKNVCH